MDEVYYMDRGENAFVFATLKKSTGGYNVLINFQSGFIHKEKWTDSDFQELIENDTIFKVDAIDFEKTYEKPKKRKKK